jgi:hypothetical protein
VEVVRVLIILVEEVLVVLDKIFQVQQQQVYQ